MNEHQKDLIARAAASTWCQCYKCDGMTKRHGEMLFCDRNALITCREWFDGYKTALIALGKEDDGEMTKEEQQLHWMDRAKEYAKSVATENLYQWQIDALYVAFLNGVQAALKIRLI